MFPAHALWLVISPTYGRFFEVMHKDGMTTLYAHLNAPARVSKKARPAVVSKWPEGAPVTRAKSGCVRTRIVVSDG